MNFGQLEFNFGFELRSQICLVLVLSCLTLVLVLIFDFDFDFDFDLDLSFDFEECYIEFIDGDQVKFWSGNNVIHGKYRFGDDVDWIYFEDFGNIDSAFWSTSTIDLYYTKDNGSRGTFVFYFLE